MGSEKEAHFYVEPVAPQHVLFAEEVARKHYVRIHALAGAGVEKIVVLVLNFGGVGKVARQIGVEVGAETPANQVVALRAHARNYFVHLLLRIEHSGEVLRGTPVCALEFYADSAPVFELEMPVFRHRHAPVFARGLFAHLRGNVENRPAFDQKRFRIYGLPKVLGNSAYFSVSTSFGENVAPYTRIPPSPYGSNSNAAETKSTSKRKPDAQKNPRPFRERGLPRKNSAGYLSRPMRRSSRWAMSRR